MARIAVEFTVTLELDIPDELAARMTMDDLAETADIAAHYCRGTSPLIVANDLAGTCPFSMRSLHEGLTPADITLGIYPDWMFPKLEDVYLNPLLVSAR